ncbi:alpha/beta fold hydrolase [Sphingobium sp. H39-3-25]|uniref:alpha/beta fold hydrolase n=1 Tax=Sphingobium arseniciresistens TaxID=3030834 RepID=UPI0023B9C6C8|nr:alpha/beta fold hydrolase [Sphingobium arseniciresistens]
MLSPVIFLPGLLCDATLWRGQVEDLADLVAPFVADLTLDDSIAAMAARTLAAAPPRFSLCGLSMGGYVAFEIMRQAPERVERLALFSTSAAPDDDSRSSERQRGMASLRHGRFVGVTSRLLSQLVHPSRIDSPEGEQVQAMAKRVGSAAFLRQQQAIMTRADSRPSLSAIHVPTMVVVGDSDVLTPPKASRTIHEGVAGSSLHILEACGHLPAMELRAQTSALLRDWLAS